MMNKMLQDVTMSQNILYNLAICIDKSISIE